MLKNMTYETCQDKHINSFKLPIEVYMEHSSTGGSFNQILSINQGKNQRMKIRSEQVLYKIFFSF